MKQVTDMSGVSVEQHHHLLSNVKAKRRVHFEPEMLCSHQVYIGKTRKGMQFVQEQNLALLDAERYKDCAASK